MDWAIEVARLLEGRHANCPQVVLTCDNLNTHTKGAFYEAFAPERARQLVRRLLSAMTRQCVSGRRFGAIETLRDEMAAWSTDINNIQRGVDWQMKVEDARCKLISVYPKIKD